MAVSKPLVLGALVAMVGLVGCGPVDFLDEGSGAGLGSPCSLDSDCVPADCCGQSSRAVNRNEAPSCASAVCNPSSCLGEAYGGCGIPQCGQDGFCRMAIDPECSPGC